MSTTKSNMMPVNKLENNIFRDRGNSLSPTNVRAAHLDGEVVNKPFDHTLTKLTPFRRPMKTGFTKLELNVANGTTGRNTIAFSTKERAGRKSSLPVITPGIANANQILSVIKPSALPTQRPTTLLEMEKFTRDAYEHTFKNFVDSQKEIASPDQPQRRHKMAHIVDEHSR